MDSVGLRERYVRRADGTAPTVDPPKPPRLTYAGSLPPGDPVVRGRRVSEWLRADAVNRGNPAIAAAHVRAETIAFARQLNRQRR